MAKGWKTQEQVESWLEEKAQEAACDVLDPALAAKLGACLHPFLEPVAGPGCLHPLKV